MPTTHGTAPGLPGHRAWRCSQRAQRKGFEAHPRGPRVWVTVGRGSGDPCWAGQGWAGRAACTYQPQRRAAVASPRSCPRRCSPPSPPRGRRHPAATVGAQGGHVSVGGQGGMCLRRLWGQTPPSSPAAEESEWQNSRFCSGLRVSRIFAFSLWPWTRPLSCGDLGATPAVTLQELMQMSSVESTASPPQSTEGNGGSGRQQRWWKGLGVRVRKSRVLVQATQLRASVFLIWKMGGDCSQHCWGLSEMGRPSLQGLSNRWISEFSSEVR